MRWKEGWFLAGSVIGLWLILSFPVAAANSLSLAWNANTEEDLAGYKLYVGTSPGSYTQTIDVGHVTTYTVIDLGTGETYYFALTAYDIFANESDYSTEVSATIAAGPQTTESTPTTTPLTTKSEPTQPAPAPTVPSTKEDLLK